jgi:hypothetical protein
MTSGDGTAELRLKSTGLVAALGVPGDADTGATAPVPLNLGDWNELDVDVRFTTTAAGGMTVTITQSGVVETADGMFSTVSTPQTTFDVELGIDGLGGTSGIIVRVDDVLIE